MWAVLCRDIRKRQVMYVSKGNPRLTTSLSYEVVIPGAVTLNSPLPHNTDGYSGLSPYLH